MGSATPTKSLAGRPPSPILPDRDPFRQARTHQPRRVLERIHRYTPRTWATPLLVGLNVAVFLAMVIGGASPLNPTVPDIVKWGANVGPLSLGGEPWRLFTSMFVHIGLLHIGMNLYVLWYIGRFVEKLLGNIGMLIVYVLAGLSGSLASAAIHPAVVSAGASGAIFGLYGAVFGYLIRNRDQVPTERSGACAASLGYLWWATLASATSSPPSMSPPISADWPADLSLAS